MALAKKLKRVLLTPYTQRFWPFFQSYPFASPASIRSANSRGVVDLDVGFFCNRVPKAANSTVISTLASLKCSRKVGSKEAKKLYLTPHELQATEMEAFNASYKFTVVRNPYTRTLSAYLDKIERLALEKGQSTSFREFLLRAKQEPKFLYGNAHWVPQSQLMLIPVEAFDFVGKVESLDADLAQITARLYPDAELPIRSIKSNATDANAKLLQYYDDELVAMVREIYREDFSAFGYSEDLPV